MITSMVQGLFWRMNNRSANQEIPSFYGTRKFITMITKSSSEPFESSPDPYILII
jgi:hypothetical protein